MVRSISEGLLSQFKNALPSIPAVTVVSCYTPGRRYNRSYRVADHGPGFDDNLTLTILPNSISTADASMRQSGHHIYSKLQALLKYPSKQA